MGQRALPLEVGGALRFRLEAKGRFEIADCGFDISHMPSASLGHYASLSFVVRGRGQKGDWLIRKLEN